MPHLDHAAPQESDPIRWGRISLALGHQEGECREGRFHLSPDRDGRIIARFRPALPVGVTMQDVILVLRERREWNFESNRIAAWNPRADGSFLGSFLDYETARIALTAMLDGPLSFEASIAILTVHGFRRADDGYRRTRNGISHVIETDGPSIRLWQRRPRKNQQEIATLTTFVCTAESRSHRTSGCDVWPFGRDTANAKIAGLVRLCDRLAAGPASPPR